MNPTILTSLATRLASFELKRKPRTGPACYDCKQPMEKALLGIFPIIVCLNHRDGVRGGGFWFYPAAFIGAMLPGDGFTLLAYEGSYWRAVWYSLTGRSKKAEPEGPASPSN